LDRQTVYPGGIPLETDLLNTNRNALIGLAKLAAAVLGTDTLANGLACTPTTPASPQVLVKPGEIYSLQNLDDTAYSSLAADTAHQILKQGLLMDAVTLNCPAPATSGYSVNYLIEATYQDVDSDPVTLPYYNASNPTQAYSGPNNSAIAQNTVRKGVCAMRVKAGVAAATGAQQTPAADSGYVGLWVVTVAYGQAQITAANIAQAANAPLLTESLTQKIGLATADARYATQVGFQQNAYSVANAGGAANAITAAYSPAVAALTNGMTLCVRASAANTAATPTFTPNSGKIAAKTIVKGAGFALVSGDIAGAGHWIELQYDQTLDKWVLLNPATGVVAGIGAAAFQAQTYTAFTTGGASGTFTLTPAPAIGAYAANQRFRVKFHAAGNGSDTLNVSGLGAKGVKQYDGVGNKVAAVIAANMLSDVEYDGADFVVLDRLPASTSSATMLTGAQNARMSISVQSASGTFTADEVIVGTDLGASYRLTKFSKLIHIGTYGAGGNIEASGLVPASGFVSLYVIYNPTTKAESIVACDANTSSGAIYTGANMPDGYTASALVGILATNGMRQFSAAFLKDRRVDFPEITVLALSSGGNSTATTYTSFSLVAAVPPGASAWSGAIGGTTTDVAMAVAGDAWGTGVRIINVNSNDSGEISFGGYMTAIAVSQVPIIETQTAYYKAATASKSVRVNVSGYSF